MSRRDVERDGIAGVRARAVQRAWAPSVERVEILGAISELFSCLEVTREQAIQQSAEVVAEVLGDAVAIMLLSEDHQWMWCAGIHHPEPAKGAALRTVMGRRYRAEQGFTGFALDSGEAVLIPRVTPLEFEVLQPELAPAYEEVGATGFVLTTMPVRGDVVGLIAQVRTRPGPPLDDDDRRFLDEVAVRLALGIWGWAAEAES